MIFDMIILFLLFSGVLYLETFMPFLASFQLLIIIVGIIASFILIYSKLSEKEWSNAYAILFYSFALADLLILVFLTRHFLAFLVVSFFATLGLLRAVFSIEECCCEKKQASLETYDTIEEPTPVEATPIIVDAVPEKPVIKKTVKKKVVKKKTKKKIRRKK